MGLNPKSTHESNKGHFLTTHGYMAGCQILGPFFGPYSNAALKHEAPKMGPKF